MLDSPAHSNLAHLLTKYYFGDVVAAIIKDLYKYDKASVALLKVNNPNIRLDDLKKGLLILVKYQLVDYVKTIKSCDYSVVPQRVHAFYRLPRFIEALCRREGSVAASALTTLTEKGMVEENVLVDCIVKRGAQESREHIHGIIKGLIARYYFAELRGNIFINIERFNRDHRDNLIVNTISNFYNKETIVGSICRVILDLSFAQTADDAVITAPVDLFSLHQALGKKSFPSENNLEAYLTRLTLDVNYRFFLPCGKHPQKGALYALNVGLVIDYLLKEHICSVITTRYGPKCCRLFRILLQKGPLLLKQIEEIIMLPARDVREYSYMLNKEGLIRNRQVPKTPDNAPGKSVFILSVEMDQVVNKVADLCCRSMFNLLVRYEYEVNINEPLLGRSKAVEQLLSNQEQTDILSDYFSNHECSQLDQTKRNLDMLLTVLIMEDEINKATLDLNEALIKIKTEIDSLKDNIVTNKIEYDREQLIDTYRTNVLPCLLQLRRLNRSSKDKLEIKNNKVKQLNCELDDLHDSWENIVFESSCLNYDVEQAKKRLSPVKTPLNGLHVELKLNGHNSEPIFDAEQVALLDHRKRLSLLDEEEAKRKSLQDRLALISKETCEIEILCQASETDLNRIRPHIRQLVEKVEPSKEGLN